MRTGERGVFDDLDRRVGVAPTPSTISTTSGISPVLLLRIGGLRQQRHGALAGAQQRGVGSKGHGACCRRRSKGSCDPWWIFLLRVFAVVNTFSARRGEGLFQARILDAGPFPATRGPARAGGRVSGRALGVCGAKGHVTVGKARGCRSGVICTCAHGAVAVGGVHPLRRSGPSASRERARFAPVVRHHQRGRRSRGHR